MKLSFTLCLSLLGLIVSAQVITIKDANTKVPVEGARLVAGNSVSRTADAEGKISLKNLPRKDQYHIFFFGYETLKLSFSELQNKKVVLLDPDELALNEIVVSASRWQQEDSRVPHKVSGISRKELSFQNPQTAADLLGSSGEVFIQKSQYGGGSPMIRGFSTNRLLYTVDGVRMNTAIFRSGNLHNVISLDPLAMERSEIIFGPGSVIYGSDAIGGVMNFFTLEPHFAADSNEQTSANLVGRYSSAASEFTAHADFSVAGEKWGSLTSFTFSDFGDLKMGKHGPDEFLRDFYVERINDRDVERLNTEPRIQKQTGYNQLNFMQKFRYKLSANWVANYGFHYSETGNIPRYDRLLRRRNGQPQYGAWYYGPQKWMMNHLSFEHSAKNPFYDQLRISFAQQSFEESRNSRGFNDSILETNLENVEAYSLNVDLEKILGEQHRFLYGLEYVYNDVVSEGSATNIFTQEVHNIKDRYPQANWGSYGVYLSYRYTPSTSWAFHAGSRYSGYDINANFNKNQEFLNLDFTKAELNQNAITGNLGAVYSASETWKLSLNLSTGFRAPNVDDIGKVFDSEPHELVVPNPDLTAEYAYNAEIGLTRVFGKMLKLDATAFYTYLDNALVRRPYHLNGKDSIIYTGVLSQVTAVQNAAFAQAYGIQFGARVKLPYNLTLRSVFTWQEGEEEDEDGNVAPARHAAPPFGSTHLVYQNNELRLDLYAEYSDEVSYQNLALSERSKEYMYAIDGNGNPYSPAWYTLNLKASYRFSKTLMLTAGLENITNQRYKTYSSGLVAAGINLVTSARITL